MVEREAAKAASAAAMGEIAPLKAMNLLLRYRRSLLGWPIGIMVVLVGASLFSGSEYVAESRFMAQGSSGPSTELAGLAAQFGLIGSTNAGESVEFYAELIESRELLRSAVTTEYRFAVGAEERDTIEGTLVELYDPDVTDPDARIRSAMAMLDDALSVETDGLTGLVTVRTAAPWPGLAEQINARILELVNEFNVEKRQSRAAAEREFIRSRLEVARMEMDTAEAALDEFMARNRRFMQSAQLALQAEQLRRQLELRHQVYATLVQAFERARMEAVRNTPVITILEHPEGSSRRVRGNLLLFAVLSIFLGGTIAIARLLLREFMRSQRERYPEDYSEYVELRTALIRGLTPRRVADVVRSATRAKSRSSG